MTNASTHITHITHITKVQKLLRMCGARMTALYLKKREYTLDETLQLMFPAMSKEYRNRMAYIQPINTHY